MGQGLAICGQPKDYVLRETEMPQRELPVLLGQDARTLQNQHRLPRLPIPTLKDTCEQYLKCVAPLLSEAEFKITEDCVARFMKEDGANMHEKLMKYGENKVSYIEDFYRNTYLEARYSLFSSNPSFVLEHSCDSQVQVAADLAMSCLHYHHSISEGTLDPWTTKAGPLCMQQLPLLFASARIVSSGPDLSESFLASSQHIVVMASGALFKLQVLGLNGEIVVDRSTLRNKLAEIIRLGKANTQAAAESLGVLTTAERDAWAATRARLESASECNRQMLRLVDSALFVVCLDSLSGLSAEQMMRNVMYGLSGSAHNRWLDKWSWIVCEDGQAGFNWEHSLLDGHTMQEFVATVASKSGFTSDATVAPDDEQAKIMPISFLLDSDAKKTIEASVKGAVTVGDGFAYGHLEYQRYGTSSMKQFKCSPDGYLQAAMAISWFKQYGSLGVPYESVLTKSFEHGRVFVARNMNCAIAHAVHAFCEPGASAAIKTSAVSTISKEVSEICKLAASGKDIDRPILGLKNMARQAGKSLSLCEDPAYSKFQALNLVTSHCGRAPIRFFCFEAAADGFSVGYFAKEGGVQFAITHLQDSELQSFIAVLTATLDEMYNIFGCTAQEPMGIVSKAEMNPSRRPRLSESAAAALPDRAA
eukprot:TRINITY_DN4576_c0_g1_i3.p1 TRINITY_DN4576_c0_g1~~TRINITY_DN4576_c0_g1_i3.p1  ORF type:complete len:646 (+),score=130.98 TRINITY_DN4576_c0_g1_i3:122-2059(+)